MFLHVQLMQQQQLQQQQQQQHTKKSDGGIDCSVMDSTLDCEAFVHELKMNSNEKLLRKGVKINNCR